MCPVILLPRIPGTYQTPYILQKVRKYEKRVWKSHIDHSCIRSSDNLFLRTSSGKASHAGSICKGKESQDYPQDLEKIIEEPIKWRILSVNDDGTNALVVADKGLAPKPFDESGTHNTWADCSLRTWLNDETDPDSFINTAFTAEERALIKPTTLENKKPDETTACDNTDLSPVLERCSR